MDGTVHTLLDQTDVMFYCWCLCKFFSLRSQNSMCWTIGYYTSIVFTCLKLAVTKWYSYKKKVLKVGDWALTTSWKVVVTFWPFVKKNQFELSKKVSKLILLHGTLNTTCLYHYWILLIMDFFLGGGGIFFGLFRISGFFCFWIFFGFLRFIFFI